MFEITFNHKLRSCVVSIITVAPDPGLVHKRTWIAELLGQFASHQVNLG